MPALSRASTSLRQSNSNDVPKTCCVTFGTAWSARLRYGSGRTQLLEGRRLFMSVTSAEANGAGSGSSAVPDGPTPDSAPRARRHGPADGPNTTWSDVPKAVAEGPKTSARSGSLNFTKIDEILKDLPFAEMRLV